MSRVDIDDWASILSDKVAGSIVFSQRRAVLVDVVLNTNLKAADLHALIFEFAG